MTKEKKGMVVYTPCQVHGKDYMSFELQRGDFCKELEIQSWHPADLFNYIKSKSPLAQALLYY